MRTILIEPSRRTQTLRSRKESLAQHFISFSAISFHLFAFLLPERRDKLYTEGTSAVTRKGESSTQRREGVSTLQRWEVKSSGGERRPGGTCPQDP